MKRKITSLLLCFLIILSSFTGCTPKKLPPVSDNSEISSEQTNQKAEAETVGEAFSKFTRELFINEITSDAVSLNYTLANPESYGIEEYADCLYSYDEEKSKSDYQEIRENLERLNSFDYEKLNADQKITYDVLKYYLELALEGEKFELYSEPLSPLYGDHAQLPVILAEFKFNSEKDVLSYLSALEDMERYYGELVEFEARKAQNGLFMSDRVLDEVLSQCENFTKDNSADFMLDTFEAKIKTIEGISPEKQAEYIEKNRTLVNVNLKNAYRILIDGLTPLKGSRKVGESLSELPNGKEYFEFVLRRKVGVDYSVPEMKATLLSFIEDLEANFLTELKQMEKGPELGEGMNSPEEMLESLKLGIKDSFPELPPVSYTVKAVDPALEEFLSPAFYLTPPIDDTKNNVIYINHSPQYADENLYSTLAHEGYPGHLYQTVYFNNAEANELRKILGSTGYVEGWATYAEAVISRGNASSYSLDRTAKYNMAVFALSDILVNYEGKSRADILEFIKPYFGESEVTANWIYDTVADNPGSYFPYIYGYIEIERLKNEAEKREGEGFNLKEFHRELLDLGPAPFTIAEKYLNKQ